MHFLADSLSVHVWLGLEQRRFSGIPLKSGSDHVHASALTGAMECDGNFSWKGCENDSCAVAPVTWHYKHYILHISYH